VSELSPDPLLGTVIHGFRVERKLGEGGMGKVFVARHEALPIYKVVKVLLPDYSRDDQIRARFLREAEAVARMDHPNVITVDNFGTLPTGELFLMMPLLTGRPLDEYLRAAGKLGRHHTLQVAGQIASALQHAHGLGIVHRDLKPGNVFMERRDDQDKVKLLDFGIAKDARSGDPTRRTRTGMSIGTPSYMACEQYDDAANVTPTADVFALAILVVEMLTGHLPWGVHEPNILYFRQKTEPPMLTSDVPRAWMPVLRAALAPDPQSRPATARAFVAALASNLEAQPPFWPSGAELLREVAPDLVKHATPHEATVRARSSGVGSVRSAAPLDATIRPISQHLRDSAQTVRALPSPARAAPTTLSASSGVTTPNPQPPRKPRRGALVLLGVGGVAVVAGVLAIGASRSERPSEGLPAAARADASIDARRPPVTDAQAHADAPAPAVDAGDDRKDLRKPADRRGQRPQPTEDLFDRRN
jgi:serine/threonine-protein kinase